MPDGKILMIRCLPVSDVEKLNEHFDYREALGQ
jgi:hypothetical protein